MCSAYTQNYRFFFLEPITAPVELPVKRGRTKHGEEAKSGPTDNFASKKVAVKQIPSSLCFTESQNH